MQKMQVLFPDPLMRRLRELSAREDRPVSEIIRRAVEHWLDRKTPEIESAVAEPIPTFHGGRILLAGSELRENAHEDRFTGSERGVVREEPQESDRGKVNHRSE